MTWQVLFFFNHLIKARSIFKHMHAILIIIVATVTIKNCNDGFLRPIRDQTSIISIWRLIHQRKKIKANLKRV